MRIGFGYDLHRLEKGRKLMIGGSHIPCDFGEKAHSDGDVLLHAIIDALYGAIADGDIGTHFPPSDDRWKDADSISLLKTAAQTVRERNFSVANLDCTVVLESPKILPYREEIRKNISDALVISMDRISVKGKTAEKTGPVGRGEAIEAYASILLE